MMYRGFVALLCALAAAWPASGPARDHAPGAAPAMDGAGPLPFFYDLYTFRGDASGTLVVGAFAVPAGRLRREQGGGQVRYRFDVSLVLADTVLKTVHRSDDSVYVAAPRPLARRHLLYTQSEVHAPPSRNTVQRVIMTDATTPGVGQLYDSAFPVPDYSGTELMLSDIALGRPDAAGGWKRGDVTLALLPTSHFPESSFDVYYEIYNLPFGRRYRTEIAVEPLAGSSGEGAAVDDPVRLRFSGKSQAGRDGSVQELRHLAGALPPGRYRLTVTIIDEDTGRSARRARVFQVRGWDPGATMVAALPR